jgi:parvulin-like peptidyl-prolyl isomerase
MKMLLILSLVALLLRCSPVVGFSLVPSTKTAVLQRAGDVALGMGLFDGITSAFSNQDFKSKDQRVRASHILIKGDDIDLVLGKVKGLLGEINDRTQKEPDKLLPIFAELARRDSQCSSAAQGGDLGLFGTGKMVKEFDMALFPDDNVPPPPGALLGPIVTDFGMHIILVTQRDQNQDQVEEKLARIDPDAAL